MKKLTLVSISYQGKRYSFFAMLPFIKGHAILPGSDIQKLTANIPIGSTFTIG